MRLFLPHFTEEEAGPRPGAFPQVTHPLTPVSQCPSALALPLPNPTQERGPFRASSGPNGAGRQWGVEEQMGLWFDFPSRCFPSLAGTGRGEGVGRGPQLFVLKTQGKDSLSAPLHKERMANGVCAGGPGPGSWNPNTGWGMFALLPDAGTSLRCGTDPGSPLGLGGCPAPP